MSAGRIVPPALTPAQWQDAATHGYQHDVPPLAPGSPPELLHYSMAMANALLPSGDPRKLSQADVTALWLVAHQLSGTIGGATCAAVAAKLAALLPPVEPEAQNGPRG